MYQALRAWVLSQPQWQETQNVLSNVSIGYEHSFQCLTIHVICIWKYFTIVTLTCSSQPCRNLACYLRIVQRLRKDYWWHPLKLWARISNEAQTCRFCEIFLVINGSFSKHWATYFACQTGDGISYSEKQVLFLKFRFTFPVPKK